MASKIRQFDFVVGVETSTQPSADTPTTDDDLVTKGYADGNYTQGSEPVADITALKAVAAADRKDGDLRYVLAESALYYFSSSSAATADEISIVDPDAGSGQWLRDSQLPKLGNQSEIRFQELISNGTSYVSMKAPAALSQNYDYTLPDSYGSSGQALSTNGSGGLSWSSPSSGNQVVSAKVADYTVLDGDDIGTINMTVSSTDRTVTLPTAADNGNRRILIRKVDATSSSNYVAIDGEGAETVNGIATIYLYDQFDAVEVECDATGWFIRSSHFGGWRTFTPTGAYTTNATYVGVYRRIANMLHMRVTVSFTGATNSSAALFDVPNSWTIDTGLVHTIVSNNPTYGIASIRANGSSYHSRVRYQSTTQLALMSSDDTASGVTFANSSNTAPDSVGNGDYMSFEVILPIVEFNLG